jgi:hypothetical protein
LKWDSFLKLTEKNGGEGIQSAKQHPKSTIIKNTYKSSTSQPKKLKHLQKSLILN